MGFLRLPECARLPERPEAPNVLEYTAAEWWVREHYARYFRDQHAIPQLVTWQLQRFFTNYDPTDPVLDLVMTIVERDFRNVLNPRLVAKFGNLLKTGASQGDLLSLLREITPGGALKPDMLGISASDTLEFDGLEVGTVKTAKPTWDELNHKLGILRDVVLPQVKIELPNLSLRETRNRSLRIPTAFSIKGSAFRLPRWARILPLPVRIATNGKQQTADWICYHPSAVWTPPGTPTPAVTDPDPDGTDGLVLYHIHRAPIPELPPRVKSFFEREFQKWRQQQGLVQQLNPAMVGVFRDSQDAWPPETLQLFGYFGLAALIILAVGVAWEVGLIAGAATLATQGLAGLATETGLMLTALEDTAVVAARLWPVAVTTAPLIPFTGTAP